MISNLLFALLTATTHAQPKTCDGLLELAISSARVGTTMAQEALKAADFTREIKGDGSLVTAADLAVSQKLVQMLADESGLPVFSEESEPPPLEQLMAWPRFWVIDPIDGTENFAKNGQDFSILIALVERDANGVARPVIGVIGRPAENQIYFGALEKGGWKLDLNHLNQPATRLLSTEGSGGVPRATMQKGTQATLEKSRFRDAFVFDRVGGNGAKFIALGEGRIDCYLAQPMKWWDIAAGDALYRYSVAEGRPPRTSPLRYVPHEGSKLFFQERGFILGESCLDAESQAEILAVLNRLR